MKKYFLVSLIVALAGAGLVISPPHVNAADLSKFDPEQIIDDGVFTNTSSMSADQIQSFLNQKNAVCLKNLTVPGLRDDNGDGVVQDTTTEAYGPETMTAAQVIKAAAGIYGLNPQVLLVTLQKEQGLITGSNCSNIDTALGYGCPDTADCDNAAKGFTRQIDYGAYHLRGYFDDTLNSVPYGVGQHMVYYNPGPWDQANNRWFGRFGDRRDIEYCGGTVLNIRNRATASLYSYTPYQPNAASLAAGYGSAEPCGAYGNRNFFHFFTDWFGSTNGTGYAFVTATNPPTTLLPNQVVNVSVTLKNLSGSTWYSDGNTPSGKRPTRLMMADYKNTPYADSSDPSWLGTRNQIKMQEASVASGENATFTFKFRGPLTQVGDYITGFHPVTDGVYEYRDIGMGWRNNTPTPQLAYDVTATTPPPATMQPGQSVESTITVKNTGNVYWHGDDSRKGSVTRLVTVNPSYRTSPFQDTSDLRWVTANQIKMQQTSVAPGQSAQFAFKWKAPSTQKLYNEAFSLVVDGYAFAPGSHTITTNVATYDYSIESVDSPRTLIPGQSKDIVIKLKNTGAATWYTDGNSGSDRPLRLALKGYAKHPYASPKDTRWLGNGSQIRLKEASVGPGEIGTFEASLAAPYKAFSSDVTFIPVRDGVEWLRALPELRNLKTSTPSPSYNYSTVAGTVNPPAKISAGQQVTATLAIKNESNTVWRNDDNVALKYGAMRLVMDQPLYRNSLFSNGDETWIGTKNQIKMLTPVVSPGETGTFTFSWTAPQAKGAHIEYFNLVIDGQTVLPFRGMGFYTRVE